MDFYSIFDENQERKEEQVNSPVDNSNASADNSENNQVMSNPIANLVESGPVRWDFKAILKQESESSNSMINETEEVNEPINSAVTDEISQEVVAVSEMVVGANTDDSSFDREWAEMLAQEEEERKAIELQELAIVDDVVSDLAIEPIAETEVELEDSNAEHAMEFAVAAEWNDVQNVQQEEVVAEMTSSVAEVEAVNEVPAMSEFEPIQLAGSEPELVSAAPVFVNVEHAWMYASETENSVAEAHNTDLFQSSLPGELPLFNNVTSENIELISNTHTHTNNNLKSEEDMKFELPEYSSIIKVIGVGGGGSNAVNHMYKFGIKGVDFLVCNTDKQALDLSPVPHKIVLGATLTEGRGAGSIPEVGRNAAIENIEDLRQVLAHNTKMVFITAGMGGGTGTGAAPVIAGVARELGILTVGIVTVPFSHEGKKRRQYAEEGIEQLKQNVDTLLVIRNDKLREMYGNLKLSDAFAHADDVLTTAAKSIAEIISLTQQINVDFADICTVMRNSGVAIMGSAVASGENRAVRAVEMSLNSPLLNDNNIIGARYVLLNIISGADEITMDELGEITDYIQEAAGQTAEIIKGYGVDHSLGDSVSVTIIATGFQQTSPVNYEYAPKSQPEKVVLHLTENKVVEAPKSEKTEPEAQVELNPLEPFLVSKQIEPIAEVKAEVKEEFKLEIKEEVKEEWSAPVSFEVEMNISSEVNEPVNEVSDANEESDFNITSSIEESFVEETISEPVLVVKEEVTAVEINPIEAAKKAEQEEIQRRASDRIQKLRDISLKLKSPQVLNELENEPAYKRRNVSLNNVPHSSESQVSRFTLTETDEKKVEIRPNNSFLHDNVD